MKKEKFLEKMRGDGFIVIFLFFLNFLLGIRFLPYGINILDEGFIVYGAKRAMNGAVLYKDVFTMYAPGPYYMLGSFMKIFGFNLFSERLYYCIIGSILAVLVFYISKRIIYNTAFSIMSALLFIFLIQLSSDRVLFALLALLCLIEYDRAYPKLDNLKYPIMIGFIAGMQVITSLEISVYLLISLCSFLALKIFVGKLEKTKIDLKKVIHQITFFIIGFLVIILPIVFYYTRIAFQEIIYCLFLWPIYIFPETMALPFPNLLSSLSQTTLYFGNRSLANCILFYLPIFIYVMTAAFFILQLYFKKYSKRDSHVFLILVFGILSFKTATVRSDIPHLMFCVIPAVILGCFLLNEIYIRLSNNSMPQVERKSNKKLILFKVIVIVIFLILAFYGQIGHISCLKNTNNYEKLSLEHAQNILVHKNEKEEIANVVSYVKSNTNSSDKIFIVPYGAMIYFLADRDNPTRYDQFLPYNTYQDQIQVIQALEKTKPKLIIYVHGWDVDGKTFESYAPLIDNYIKQKCFVVEQYGIYEIWSYILGG